LRKHKHSLKKRKCQNYRIYQRISREILNKKTSKFYQFDLHSGSRYDILGAIQIIRDTSWGGGGGSHQCHQMTHGEGGSKIGQKVIRII
jgi:hypothetical protein